jgi:transposase-like protein
MLVQQFHISEFNKKNFKCYLKGVNLIGSFSTIKNIL